MAPSRPRAPRKTTEQQVERRKAAPKRARKPTAPESTPAPAPVEEPRSADQLVVAESTGADDVEAQAREAERRAAEERERQEREAQEAEAARRQAEEARRRALTLHHQAIAAVDERERRALAEFDRRRRAWTGRVVEIVQGKQHFDAQRQEIANAHEAEREALRRQFQS